jgi:hypothetical protein
MSNYALIWASSLALFMSSMDILEGTAYAQFSSIQTQSPTSYKGGIIKLDQVDLIENVGIDPTRTKIIIKEAGTYFFGTSALLGATSAGGKGYMDIWFIKNGASVANSNRRVAIPHYTAIAAVDAQIVMNLAQGDEISLGFSSSSPSLGFIFVQPENEPAMTSIMLAMFNLSSR